MGPVRRQLGRFAGRARRYPPLSAGVAAAVAARQVRAGLSCLATPRCPPQRLLPGPQLWERERERERKLAHELGACARAVPRSVLGGDHTNS